MMPHKSLARMSFAAALLAGFTATQANAVPVEIDSITTTGDTLTAVTVGSTTYNTLISPTSITSNTATTDFLHKDAAAPASLAAAISTLDLGDGALNTAFEAQFSGALTDDTLVFLIINEQDDTPADSTRIYAIDAAGTRLGSVSFLMNFSSFGSMPVLVGATSYNRTTNGSAGADLSRMLVGAAFTLNNLGLGGLGATGLEFETTSLDPQEIGLAVPEPATLALLSLGGLTMLPRRRA